MLGLDANALAIDDDVPRACLLVDVDSGPSWFLLLLLSLALRR